MKFFFAKLFEEYERKNDSPTNGITFYISLVYFLLSIAILLPIKVLIEKTMFNGQIEYDKTTIVIVVFGLLALITLLVYRVYIKNKRIFELVKRYQGVKINRVLLYIIAFLTPMTLLILAGTITVCLNGGEILGNEINGLLE